MSAFSFKRGDNVETKIVTGRNKGLWIPCTIIRLHYDAHCDLEVTNPRSWKVARYAIRVPLAYVRKIYRKFDNGDFAETKILRGKNRDFWIPCRIIKPNADGTWDIRVIDHKKYHVPLWAIHVPEKYLRIPPAMNRNFVYEPRTSSATASQIRPPSTIETDLKSPTEKNGKHSYSPMRPAPLPSRRSVRSSSIPEQQELDSFEEKEDKPELESRPTLSAEKQKSAKDVFENWDEDFEDDVNGEELLAMGYGFVSSNEEDQIMLETKSDGESPQNWDLDSPEAEQKVMKLSDNLSMMSDSTTFDDECKFVNNFLPGHKRDVPSNNKVMTVGVKGHNTLLSSFDLNTPLDHIANWLNEEAGHHAVNSFSFNQKFFDGAGHGRKKTLADVLGGSIDAASKGLAFFVGPVNGQMAYKISVADTAAIHRISSTDSLSRPNHVGNNSGVTSSPGNSQEFHNLPV